MEYKCEGTELWYRKSNISPWEVLKDFGIELISVSKINNGLWIETSQGMMKTDSKGTITMRYANKKQEEAENP